MTEARSYLYVPGHRPERFAKALAAGADAVILDLEDAVPVAAKDDARDAVGSLLAATDRAWVRINAGERGLADLAVLGAAPGLVGAVVPKASGEALAAARTVAPAVRLCALVESASGVASAGSIAGVAGVERIALGEVDLAADLRLGADPLPEVLWSLRVQVVVAAAAASLPPPIGPVFLDVRDPEGLRRSTADLRRAGFWSRQLIHPSQVETVHDVLTPTQREQEQAARLLDAAARADGGVFVDETGRMVDEAVLRSARHVLLIAADR